MVATSTMVAISAGSSAATSANAAAARRQADEACRAYMAGFDASTASQSQQIQYARCVERFAPMSESDVSGAKLLVLLAFVFVLGGAVVGGALDSYDKVFGALMGAISGFFLLVALCVIVAGVSFLLS